MNEIHAGRTCNAMLDEFHDEMEQYFKALVGSTFVCLEQAPLEGRLPDYSGQEEIMVHARDHFMSDIDLVRRPVNLVVKGEQMHTLGFSTLTAFTDMAQLDMKDLIAINRRLEGQTIIGIEIERNWTFNDLGTDLEFAVHWSNGDVMGLMGWTEFDPTHLTYWGKHLHQEYCGEPIRLEFDPVSEPESFAEEIVGLMRKVMATRPTAKQVILMTPEAYVAELNRAKIYPKADGVYVKDDDGTEYNLSSRYEAHRGFKINLVPGKRAAIIIPDGSILVHMTTGWTKL